MSPLSIVFFGTSDFAVPSLQALAKDNRFKIICVITQPDRPVGRHAVLTAPPVKQTALELGLPVKQYESVKTPEATNEILAFKAELAVVISFGQIIPQMILDGFPLGMINIHGSLLPKYRGSSPIQAAILNGDDVSGITIMKLDAKMDHGPILQTAEETILPTDTAGSLHDRLAILGAKILPQTLIDYKEEKIQPRSQDHEKATLVKLLQREDGEIKPSALAAEQAERLVRAYSPWPGTYLTYQDHRLKVKEALVGKKQDKEPGSPVITEQGYPAIILNDGVELILKTIQPEGKRDMDGIEFLRGHTWSNEKTS